MVREVKRSVVLVGFSGSGKSTVVSRLAQNSSLKVIDLDAQIALMVGKSVSEFIRVEGEPEFRLKEREALGAALESNADVIAAGGGILTVPETAALIEERCLLVELSASAETLAERTVADERRARDEGLTQVRPLLFADGRTDMAEVVERINQMLARRRSGYSRAKVRIATDWASAEDIASTLGLFAGDGLGAHRAAVTEALSVMPARFDPTGPLSELVIGSNLVEALPVMIKARMPKVARVAVVTDEAIGRHWREPVVQWLKAGGVDASAFTVPSGESSKTLSRLEELGQSLLESGFTRSDAVLALGGGVVGDLGGLLASLFMRGVPLIQVPTTLLAQVDSAIGGKTGVNLEGGKNSLGTFHPALLVLSDPRFFSTLPEREFRSGLAEVVKYGLIWSAEFLNWFEQSVDSILSREPDAMLKIVESSSRAKLNFVLGDLKDLTGRRAILNFGHTVGHAVERLAGYGELLHGEAIAIGMCAALRLSAAQGWADRELVERAQKLLSQLGLPTQLPAELTLAEGDSGVSLVKWRESLLADKKRVSTDLDFVVVEAPGKARVERVPLSLILQSISGSI